MEWNSTVTTVDYGPWATQGPRFKLHDKVILNIIANNALMPPKGHKGTVISVWNNKPPYKYQVQWNEPDEKKYWHSSDCEEIQLAPDIAPDKIFKDLLK